MATRLKTVHYAFERLATSVNNTLTNFTQLTLYLPESSVVIKSAIVTITFDDVITATGGSITTKNIGLRLGANGYTTITSSNTLTNSGENISAMISANFGSIMNSTWTGTSMTCDLQFQVNQSTGTTLGLANICAVVEITYEYDDTSATHIKTVMVPLNAPITTLATAKPGSATDTIPALDTYLPESTKTIRNMFIVLQGNENNTTTTDFILNAQIDSLTAFTSTQESALASSRWCRWVWQINSLGMTTNSTHGFYLWSSVATKFHHLHAYMVVTYEFDPAATTSVMNSVMLPMEFVSPMGGTNSADYQRASRELWVQEQSPVLNKLAYYCHFEQAAALANLFARIGTGSFINYGANVVATACGGVGFMVRDDSGATLSRGRNTLSVDIYRTDTADFGWNVSGFFIVNYTSDKHADGVGAHNHTVITNITTVNTVVGLLDTSATSLSIPEAEFFITGIGTRYIYISNTSSTPAGINILVERLVAEGGMKWEQAYVDSSHTDPEVGIRTCYSQIRPLFKRFPGDLDSDRVDLGTNRRWRLALANAATAFHHLDLLTTYHTITYDVAGNITDSNGGTVTIDLHRSSNGEKIGTTSRVGDGAYSFVWYDNTENVFVSAREDGSFLGRSDDGVAV